MLKHLYISFILMVSTAGFSQVEEVEPNDFIKTITFKSNTNQSELPILTLNERLYLEFDVLSPDEDDYYYIIEHYNYDWTKSNLMKSEYLKGLDNLRIVNYENSFNTYQIYSNYRLQIPNKQTRLKVTGNYLIKIFDEDDEIVFSRKFMVYENLANIGVQLKRSRDVRDVNTKQSVDFVVNTTNFSFNNPKQTINTVILQNNNLKTAISGLKPQYILGNELIYRYTTETSFWGGNEYLYFETKDVRGTNLGVQFTDLEDLYHSFLYLDGNRYNRGYTYNPDINGNFQITILDRDNPSIEADYTVVHFSLLNPELSNESIYVYGAYNNYALNASNQMIFNPDSGVYEKDIKLKQGFYNYKYVLVNSQGELEEGVISGDFYETENNYKVIVYYRDLGARYDRIVGFGEGSSTQIGN
ncbi:MAG: DUF5103 domain-containing protein [Flavobacteriaceae bacterium]|nr:DUF5103 domain-containing protein [Flavobacteriaceae bacterium]MDA7727793.1 DUF5103 domain-containing protein [Flavobacteriaceae bacterium]MDG1309069.1 DUF5103 domain-containing protein [Flavobacteriaceae bacterium]